MTAATLLFSSSNEVRPLRPSRVAWTEHDDRHAGDSDPGAQEVPGSWPISIDEPEPQDRHANIDAAIRSIHATCSSGVQRKQPSEEHETCEGRNEQPCRSVSFEPEIRQIATHDLRNRGDNEQTKRS